MKRYISTSKQNWCQDSEGNVIYEGDTLQDLEGWEWLVDNIHDDGSVDLSLLDDSHNSIEKHYGEYSVNDIRSEFTQI